MQFFREFRNGKARQSAEHLLGAKEIFCKLTQNFLMPRRAGARRSNPFFRLALGVTFYFALFSTGNLHAKNSTTNNAEKNSTNQFGGSLEFLDGSVLQGQLGSIDSQNGLVWIYPDAAKPIRFVPQNLAWLHFSPTEIAEETRQSTCQFQFANGDQFYGNLLALDEKELELQTWFGGKFKTPRAALRSIHFFPKGSGSIYEGPTGLEGWKIGRNANSRSWQYRDGMFVSESPNTIGRDVNLPDTSRVEFDLGWKTPFNLLFSIYTSSVEGFNYNSSSYMFFITPGNVSVQRINAGSGSSTIGRSETPFPMMTQKKAHLEFLANKSESFLQLLIDGKSVGEWHDNSGWVGKGSGILFYTQTEGASVTISNIKISEWDGRSGSDLETNSPSGKDELYLINHDTVDGKIGSLRDGKLRISSSNGSLEIPIERVTEISFGAAEKNSIQRDPWEIQASVFGGGTISFNLEKWSPEKISGRNKNFGAVALDAKSIREIRFNPGKPKASEIGENDILWEANE
jgi:hypothetical protein